MEKGKVICAEHSFLDGACGVDGASDFRFEDARVSTYDYWNSTSKGTKPNPSAIAKWKPDAGSGWLIMGFNSEPESEAAYVAFTAKYKLVFQTPVRNNKFHGKNHPFFFAVFDMLKDKKK